MATPFESATLNIQLFDLRREPVLREARAWFMNEFSPETFAELLTFVGGERNASVRMVLGYWDMAASMVTTGAIDGDAFRAAHSEIVGAFAKVSPFLAELRKVSGVPTLCCHMEAVVLGAPDGQAALERTVEAVRTMARARRSAGQTASPSEAGG